MSILISFAIIAIICGISYLKFYITTTGWYQRRQERKFIKRYNKTMERFSKSFERDYRRGKVKIPEGMTVEEYYMKSEEAYAQHLLQCNSYKNMYPKTPVQNTGYPYTKPIGYSPENIDDEIDEDYLFLDDDFRP
ncbi:MAG: hypothetical protein ACI31A_05285 [Candidatus Limisoma sp.]